MKEKNYLWLLPIRSILFVIIALFIAFITQSSLNNSTMWWTLVLNIVNFITIGILFLICKKRKISLMKLFNDKKVKYNKIEIIGGAIFIPLLALIGMYIVGWFIYKQIPYTSDLIMQKIPISLAIINIITLPILTTIAEEGIYLGIGVNQIKNYKLSIAIPLFFYMIQHSFFPFVIDISFMFYRFFSFFLMILAMCLYYKRKGKIIPIMAGHFVTNFVTTIELLMMSM